MDYMDNEVHIAGNKEDIHKMATIQSGFTDCPLLLFFWFLMCIFRCSLSFTNGVYYLMLAVG